MTCSQTEMTDDSPPAADPSGQPGTRPRRLGRGRRLAVAAVLGLAACLGFGLGDADSAALLAFTQAADRWQVAPEFRAVATDYCVRASAVMRTRPFFVPARRVIMTIRSIPGLPKQVAVNPTSHLHYDSFSRGPLSAYLHLCSEQDVPAYVKVVEDLGRRTGRTDADLRAWLGERKMDFPIAKDSGAVRSVGDLLDDTDAARTFDVRTDIRAGLGPRIAAVARGLGIPADPSSMTPDQQQAVLDRLDGEVRRNDPELWRTKQVNDFCGGIWAQVYGPAYNQLVNPFLAARTLGRALVVLILASLLVRQALARRREDWGAEADELPDEPEPASQPVPAGGLSSRPVV